VAPSRRPDCIPSPLAAHVITAVHTLLYAEDPEAARAFVRDVLRMPYADTGGGWLIFRTGPSEMGVHPASWEHEGRKGSTDQRFDVSLMCDDLTATMADLADRGAEFDGDVEEEPWGRSVALRVPGAGTLMLFEPKYDPPATAVPHRR
jgi:catechol 2,3-dioxygenase-like lactoylglutathione lyase family enzyme